MQHHFAIEDAEKYGVNAAILLYNIEFWINKNKANGHHFYDGYYWTYNSTKAFLELFPYLTEDKIKTALKRLEDEGIIKTANYNKSSFDKTKWYTSTRDYQTIDVLKIPNRDTKNPQPIPYINTYNKTQIINEIVDNDLLVPIIHEWLAYKKEKKQTYKPIGLKKFCETLKEYSGNNPEIAKKIVDKAICNNHAGIYPFNGTITTQKEPEPKKERPRTMYDEIMDERKRHGII